MPLSIKGVIRGGSGRGGASAAAAPDTYVVVTTSERYLDVANDTNTNSIDSTDTLTSRQNNDESIWGRTEIVKASYNPQFTTTIPFEYNYATPTATPNRTILFYVHVFRQFSNRNIHRYGTAQFSALDLIYTKNMIRMKRLRDTDSSISNKNSKYLNAGCVYCQLERVLKNTHDGSHSHQPSLYLQLHAYDLIPRRTKRKNPSSHRHTASLDDKFDSGSSNLGTAFLLDTIVEIAKPMQIDSTTQQSSGGWIVVHRSTPVLASLNPMYDALCIPIEDLYSGGCDGMNEIQSRNDNFHHLDSVFDQPIRISIYAMNKSSIDSRHRLVGFTQTTVRHLLSMSENYNQTESDVQPCLKLQRSVKKMKEVGTIQVRNAYVCDQDGNRLHSIFNHENDKSETLHLPQQGTAPRVSVNVAMPSNVVAWQEVNEKYLGYEINLCVAIDYTSSNGYPYDSCSYHYHSEASSLNDYEETIVTIGNALFGSNKFQCNKSSIPVWGFGAKYDGTVRHIFQCGSKPTVNGIGGVLDAYQSVFQSDFIMAGPTNFAHVAQAAASKAKRFQDISQEHQQYVVLLVITDGIMNNYDETLERMNIYSAVPLSVVFVGIGHGDFSKMYDLCKDHCNATQSVGRDNEVRVLRPIITFVEFREHQHDILSLGDAALRYLPLQICQYGQLQCKYK